MTFYDRAVAGLSRRELLKIGWMLGAAAVAQPLSVAPSAGQTGVRRVSVFAGRRLRRSAARRDRALDAPGTEAARGRRHADVGRGRGLGDRARRALPDRRAEGNRRGAARARAQRARRGRRARAGARLLLPLSRRRRSEPDRPHQDRARRRHCRSIACASPSAAASTTKTATSPRSGGSPKSSSTSSSTPATTSTKGAPTAAGPIAASASTTATKSTRSGTIATATRSTRAITI